MCLQDGPFWAKFLIGDNPYITNGMNKKNRFHWCYFTSEISGVSFKCNLRPIKIPSPIHFPIRVPPITRLTQPSSFCEGDCNPRSFGDFQPQKNCRFPTLHPKLGSPVTLALLGAGSELNCTWVKSLSLLRPPDRRSEPDRGISSSHQQN